MKRGSGIGNFLRKKENNNKIKLSIKVDKVKKKNKSNNAGNNDGYVKSKIEKITKNHKKSQNKKITK